MKVGFFRSSMALKSGTVTLGEARLAARDAKAARRDSSASAAKGSSFWDQHLGHFGSTGTKRKVAKKAYVKKAKASVKRKPVKTKARPRRTLAKKK